MIKLIILQILLSSSLAFAGQEIGNGGEASRLAELTTLVIHGLSVETLRTLQSSEV